MAASGERRGCDYPRRPPRHLLRREGSQFLASALLGRSASGSVAYDAQALALAGFPKRVINDAGLQIIKDCEQLRLVAYLPTPDDVWTIGYGHTNGVKEGDTCTEEQAEAWLKEDVHGAENCVALATAGTAITENQFSALVSFVFNCGCRAFKTSTLLQHFLDGDDERAAAEFGKWVLQGKKKLGGLVKRRALEEALFRS